MHCEIKLGKWEDLFPSIENESVNLVLTDPPYGLGYISNIPGDKTWNKSGESSSRFTKAIAGDSPEENAAIDWKKFFAECYRVLAPDSYCFMHCNVPFVGQKWEDIGKSGLIYKGTIAWSKKFAIGGDLRGASKRDWEPIVYLAKGKPKLNPVHVMRNGKMQLRKRISEIEDWVFPLPKEEKCGHPTQKPIKLAQQIIELTTQPEQLVIDPFAGSATTLVAARNMGRNALGFEMDPEFHTLAETRLKLTQI